MTPTLILSLLNALENLAARLPEMIQHFRQSSEATAEQRAEFAARLERLRSSAAWRVEPDPALIQQPKAQ